MAGKIVDMSKIKQVFRLHDEGKSNREIARMLNINKDFHHKQNLVASSPTTVLSGTYNPAEKLYVDFAGDKLSC